MSYRQLVTPNLNPTISENGKVLPDWYGWCLAFVHAAFGTGYAGDYATMAWDKYALNPHADSNLPSGVYVPIYFSGYGGQGHIAIYKDGKVYSSPWHHKASYDEMTSIAQTAQIYNVTYVGWSEGLASKQLVEAVASAPPYTVEAIATKQVVINKETHRWNLTYTTFNDIAANPLSAAHTGDSFHTSAIVHHQDGYTYYAEDNSPYSFENGFNTLDCNNYVAAPVPPVVVPPPASYVPPAGAAPVTKATTYKLVTTLPYYANSTDAQADRNAVSIIKEGTYIVWEKQGIFWNLTTDNQTNQNKWVNTLDNKTVPPTTSLSPPPMDKPVTTPNPAPMPSSVDPSTVNWHGTLDLRYAGVYVFLNHNRVHDANANKVEIYDLESGQVKKATSNGTYAQFSGKVKWTDGNWYGRMKDSDASFHWYAAHIEDLEPYNAVYGMKTTLQERETLHTLTTMDRLEMGLAKIKTIGTGIWDIVAGPKGDK